MALETPTPPKSDNGALFVLAIAVIAYRWGRAAGAKSRTPADSFGGIAKAYVGFRALDVFFGRLGK